CGGRTGGCGPRGRRPRAGWWSVGGGTAGPARPTGGASGSGAESGTTWESPLSGWSALQWKDNASGAQTERRGGAGPVGGLLGGKDPTDRFFVSSRWSVVSGKRITTA